jgi:sigma-B regulation protein RsbU (phosphoserine phosphatase)
MSTSSTDDSMYPATGDGAAFGLRTLMDYLDKETLQELQDTFTAVTGLGALIIDPEGHWLTAPTDASAKRRSDRALDQLLTPADLADEDDAPLRVPIMVGSQLLGSVTLDASPMIALHRERDRLIELYRKLGAPEDQLVRMAQAACDAFAPRRAVAVQNLFLLANHIGRLCSQELQLRERVDELDTLYSLSTLLSRHSDLQTLLDAAAQSVAAAIGLRAVAVRLLDEDTHELIVRAVYNLSQSYLGKGPILLDYSELAKSAFRDQVVYVERMADDPRTLYPEEAQREGIVSALIAPMMYKGKPVGLLQCFTGEQRRFSDFEVNLIRSIAQLTATAIENAKLDASRKESENVQRQLRLAADVQARMMPSRNITVPNLVVAGRYVPSFDLGGDFYDFIDLEGQLGITLGDVVGKGIAASLLMASVRSSLRAFAQDVYDIDEVMSRVNIAMCRDTLPNEFVTLFYGVVDPQSLRLTYCNAGHEPGLLLRGDDIIKLETGGMIAGVDPEQHYEKGIVDLQPGDMLLLHSDGLTDAQNFDQKRFGRDRINSALRAAQNMDPTSAINQILWEMRRYIGLNESIDDTTLVVLKVTGDGRLTRNK